MEIALYILGALVAALTILVGWFLADRWKSLERRQAELEDRVAQLETERPSKRLSHRDTLNIENAAAAVVKVLRDLDNLRDYTENSLVWLGKVRGLVDDEEVTNGR